MAQAVVRGVASAGRRSALTLLAEGWAGELLGLLDETPASAEEIDRRLGDRLSCSPRYALRTLIQMGLVVRLPGEGLHARSRYELDAPGRDLLEAVDALERWRARWASAHAVEAGMRRLVARREAYLVVRALVEEALPFSELQRRIPGLSAGTLHRVLSGLREQGVLCIDPRSKPSHPLYELREPARRLGRVTVLSWRWRWRWAADDAPIGAGDLPGLVHLLAPLTKVPRELEGVCQLAVQPPAHWPKGEILAVWVRVAGGRLSALALQPILSVQTRMSGPSLAWCDALLEGRVAGIEVVGGTTLAEGVISALATAISG